MEWFRWYHGAISDDKWPLIARKSGQSIAVVVAVWAALLECASQAEDRGSLDSFDPESMDALLQLEDGVCQAVLDALQSGTKPRIMNGRITKWNERQPKREDGSAERAKEYRERKKLEKANSCNNANASERIPNALQTQTNTEKIREEKKREEYTTTQSSTEKRGRAREHHTPQEESPAETASSPSLPTPSLREEAHLPAIYDSPNIEFEELRELYDRTSRHEAPRSGFAEYKQLRQSRDWPGMSALSDAIDTHARDDPKWRQFAPGLGRFLKEHWWLKKPCAIRAASGQAPPEGAIVPRSYAQAQDYEERARADRVLRRLKEKKNGNVPNDQRSSRFAGAALPEGASDTGKQA